jgi:hypothetical protein
VWDDCCFLLFPMTWRFYDSERFSGDRGGNSSMIDTQKTTKMRRELELRPLAQDRFVARRRPSQPHPQKTVGIIPRGSVGFIRRLQPPPLGVVPNTLWLCWAALFGLTFFTSLLPVSVSHICVFKLGCLFPPSPDLKSLEIVEERSTRRLLSMKTKRDMLWTSLAGPQMMHWLRYQTAHTSHHTAACHFSTAEPCQPH